MELHDSVQTTIPGPLKWKRVFPIMGLLLYYLGNLICSLEVENAPIFLLQAVIFSAILLIGLFLQKKEVIILGELIVIIGSAGPIAEFILFLLGGELPGFGALGGGIVLFSLVFIVLGILVWFKK